MSSPLTPGEKLRDRASPAWPASSPGRRQLPNRATSLARRSLFSSGLLVVSTGSTSTSLIDQCRHRPGAEIRLTGDPGQRILAHVSVARRCTIGVDDSITVTIGSHYWESVRGKSDLLTTLFGEHRLGSLGERKTSAVGELTRAQSAGCERSFVSQFMAHTIISVTVASATKPETALAKRDLQNGDESGADLTEESAIGVRAYAVVSESLGVVLDSSIGSELDRSRRRVLLACSHRCFHNCSSRSSARTIHMT
jgi:hypothetical protein